MCVCSDSLWRKPDMCRITRDTEDGWLVLEAGAMASSDPLNKDTSEVGPVLSDGLVSMKQDIYMTRK